MSAKPPISTEAAEPPKAVLLALKKLLRPLVRLLLSFQITLPYLIELLKRTYVEVAEEDFKLDNKKQTDTRISLLTGVHRKDTRRLRHPDHHEDIPEATTSIGAQLVAHWVSQSEYLDEQGEPKRLPLKAEQAGDADFESLVASVCKQDIRARVVLDEWQRLGMASLIDGKWVELNKKAFIADTSLDEKAFFFGMNLSDHLEAASQNLRSDRPPFIERCVYYDGLNDDAIQELQRMAEAQGMEMLQSLNKRALELRQQQVGAEPSPAEQSPAEPSVADSSGHCQRMNLGFYFFHERDKEQDDVQS
ncbi:DUF6502 family protein [Litoribrevibacter albus]|nr:DUF6502 family protein [Litoribrevibacter albus]